MMRIVCLLAGLFIAMGAFAIDQDKRFDGPEMQAR